MTPDTALKSNHRLENFLHLLLIVIAVGALGLVAWEVEADGGRVRQPATMITPLQQQYA